MKITGITFKENELHAMELLIKGVPFSDSVELVDMPKKKAKKFKLKLSKHIKGLEAGLVFIDNALHGTDGEKRKTLVIELQKIRSQLLGVFFHVNLNE